MLILYVAILFNETIYWKTNEKMETINTLLNEVDFYTESTRE